MRTGRFEDALAATDVAFAYVTLSLPAWENGTRYSQADALRALGRFDEAADTVASSLASTPEGANGRRWGMRARVLQVRIAYEAGQPWQQDAAENLTDELLHASWYGAAVELMVVRARAAKSEELASEAATLSMGLGDPIMAAGAVDTAGTGRSTARWHGQSNRSRVGYRTGGANHGGLCRGSRMHSASR